MPANLLPTLEELMGDAGAVMHAAHLERAAIPGVSLGGAAVGTVRRDVS